MRIKTEEPNNVMISIKQINLTYEDNTVIELHCIQEYDMALDLVDESVISITDGCINKYIVNRFSMGGKKNQIKEIYIEGKAVDEVGAHPHSVFWTIPCKMKVRNITIYSKLNSCTIELEGLVG